MQDYRKLKIWQKGYEVTLSVYRLAKDFPQEERYGLTSQIRRAAASVPANIAEGCGRGSQAELARFITIASGSAFELEHHTLLSKDLDYLKKSDYETLATSIDELKRMLYAFIKKRKTENL